MNLTAHFNSLLKKWAERFKVAVPKLQISKEGNTDMTQAAYFEMRQTISMNPLYTAPAREHKMLLRFMEYTLGHEFGHHVIWSGHGRRASEHEANMIAKELTGLTPREAEHLLEAYLPFTPRGFEEQDMIEEEMKRAALEQEEC